VQLKDSNAWYDHINGKRHNQILGMSMVVERVTVDKVRDKLAGLKRKQAEGAATQVGATIEEIQRRIEEKEREAVERAHQGAKRKKLDEKRDIKVGATVNDQFEFEEEDISAFGLPGDFGSTKKK
jgi:U4/U6.U5 tri-snRNP component SNU23